jgi:small subunit ribosomal protein S1
MDTATATPPSTDDFAAMLDESLLDRDRIEGSVLTGTVIAIENDEAVVDVGL